MTEPTHQSRLQERIPAPEECPACKSPAKARDGSGRPTFWVCGNAPLFAEMNRRQSTPIRWPKTACQIIARMRPVVEAAEAWNEVDWKVRMRPLMDHDLRLERAVQRYRKEATDDDT